MDWLNFVKALFLGGVEGLTEFLPISSTGHLILFGELISFQSTQAKVFEVVIQLGASLAVCWLYRARIMNLIRGLKSKSTQERHFAACVLLAFLPSALAGALLIGFIKSALFNPMVVAAMLIIGGIVIMLVERMAKKPATEEMHHITLKQALGVGLAQCAAMIPGTSRSGATIMGGMLAGLSRKAATEFSFFLAIPTMLGAASYDLFRHHHLLSLEDMMTISGGFLAAFISALFTVRALIRFIERHSFEVFAWYRIILGVILIAFLSF
jgi:undecaprenyl-diphosphatase